MRRTPESGRWRAVRPAEDRAASLERAVCGAAVCVWSSLSSQVCEPLADIECQNLAVETDVVGGEEADIAGAMAVPLLVDEIRSSGPRDHDHAVGLPIKALAEVPSIGCGKFKR